jgi:hypothetical protein
VEPQWLDWRKQGLTLPAVCRLLAETQPEVIGLRDVPNARVQAALGTLAWLTSAAETETVSHLWGALAQLQAGGVDPEQWWSLSVELPYDIDISWSAGGVDGC